MDFEILNNFIKILCIHHWNSESFTVYKCSVKNKDGIHNISKHRNIQKLIFTLR